MKNNKFIFDHKYIHDYGTLDKTLMGSKTTKTLISSLSKDCPGEQKNGKKQEKI